MSKVGTPDPARSLGKTKKNATGGTLRLGKLLHSYPRIHVFGLDVHPSVPPAELSPEEITYFPVKETAIFLADADTSFHGCEAGIPIRSAC